MELREALEIFEIKLLNDIDEAKLKRKYRKLMKMYHPDSGNGSNEISAMINEAYSLLKESLKNDRIYREIHEEKQENIFLILIEDYSKLLRGLDVVQVNTGEMVNKNNIIWRLVKYLIKYTIVIDGEEIQHTAIVSRNMENVYETRCEVYLNENEDIKEFMLNVYGKQYNIVLDKTKIYLIDIGDGVKLKMAFERRRLVQA